jgi:hypothetical protein
MRTIFAGLLTLAFMFNGSAFAQETDDASRATEIDELQPAVSTSEVTTADRQETKDDGDTRSAPVLAQGVTRFEGTTGVMDELELGRSEITGNQELPKVLYIVPWQKSGPAELMGRPVNTLLEEVMAPIDRTEFKRQVEYYDDLYRQDEE